MVRIVLAIVVFIAFVLYSVTTVNALDVKVKEIKQLTFEGGNSDPAWSPDGKKIAFVGNRNSITGLYIMDVDGSNVRLLYNVSVTAPSWMPNSKKIAFHAIPCCPYFNRTLDKYIDPEGYGYPYIIELNNSNLTRVVLKASVELWAPSSVGFESFSPDGKNIAYSNDCGTPTSNIAVAEFDYSNSTVLASKCITRCGEGQCGYNSPSWSPSGRIIALKVTPYAMGTISGPSKTEFVSMKSDGTDERVIKEMGGYNTINPTLSPDGNNLAFSHAEDKLGSYDIYIMNLTIYKIDRLTFSNLTQFDYMHPSWSQDSKKITFSSLKWVRLGDEEIQTLNIYVMELDFTEKSDTFNVTLILSLGAIALIVLILIIYKKRQA